MTIAGRVMGTLGYMAPEMVSGSVVDGRTDLFAIGVMVVERESAEIRALDAIVQRCLAKDPRDRYGSAVELSKGPVPALARCDDGAGPGNSTPPDSPTL